MNDSIDDREAPSAALDYWHGGAPGRNIGDLIRSPNARQVRTPHSLALPIAITRADRVYITTSRGFAEWFAGQYVDDAHRVGTGTLYRVAPIGRIRTDPDFAGRPGSYEVTQARVVDIERNRVQPFAGADAARRFGPFMTWADGSPVYDSNGRVLRSPQAREAGQSQAAWDESLPRWANVIERKLLHL